MEKSIEKLWKQAFLSEGELKTPRVNNFYERKSLLIVDKLIARMNLEFKLLFPLAIMTFLINLALGNGFVWATLGVVPFIPWLFIARRQIQNMKSVPAESNCLAYLEEVKKELQRILKYNLRASVISVMLVGFPTFLYTYIKQKDKTLGEIFGWDNFDYDALWMFMIIPIVMVFSYAIFKIMHKLTNGIELNLYALIDDLKTLKS